MSVCSYIGGKMKNFDSFEEECQHVESVKSSFKHSVDESVQNEICNILKILGEPLRLKIVLALNEGEMCVFHIVAAVKSTQSAVSHQLRILKDNRIIRAKRFGQNIVYSLQDEHIMQIINIARIHVEE